MKNNKIIAIIMTVVMLLSTFGLTAFAADEGNLSLSDGLEALQTQFAYGKGPETEGITVDYRYFTPQKEAGESYPLVIWLHGLGEGAYEGKQVINNHIAYWTSSEFQSRFSGSEGAYIFAPRAPEDIGILWGDSTVFPLRAAIDDFIADHSDIDISRIYVGGFSMGGMMTLKMCVAYPDMFAAAFPICPAWTPSEESIALMADIPVWLTSGVMDPLVSYSTSVVPTWEKIAAFNTRPESCRFSTLEIVTYPDGKPTSSSHHSWFAVNYDMFNSTNGDYQFMSTVNGKGDEVELDYPNGMISWLSAFSSDFDGSVATDSGNIDPNASEYGGVGVKQIIINLLHILSHMLQRVIDLLDAVLVNLA